MALYGSVNAVKAMLRADVGSTFNADADARLTALRAAVSAYIEEQTGREFGVIATETVAIRPGPRTVDLLLLPKPVRTISAVTLDPESTGTAWTGGTALPLTAFDLAMVLEDGTALAMQRTDGGTWPALVVIAANWGDADSVATVPDDITYAANYLIAERFKLEQASPAGQIGPDGSVVPIRNSLKDPLVTATVERWRLASRDLVL